MSSEENTVDSPKDDADESTQENVQGNSPEKSSLRSKMGLTNPMQVLQNILDSHGRSDMENPDLPVLDSNHPLMIKYQNDLKQHLLKLHQETDEQLFELQGAIKDQRKENDEIGKHNCALQQQLVQCTDGIKKLKEDYNKVAERKDHLSKKVKSVEEAYETCKKVLEQERKKELELQAQVETLALKIVTAQEWNLQSKSEVDTKKREVDKTTKDQENLEIDKLKQDLLITHLEADKHSLTDKINLYKAQCGIKKEEIADLRKVLTEAAAELQAIHLEKLKLLQQWKHSIAFLEKRDETCAIMRNSVRKYKDDMIALNMDITSHKKSVHKELEKNEQLTLQLLHCTSDISQIKKRINDCKSRQLSLEAQHAFFEKIVHSTDVELENLKNVKASNEKELTDEAKQLEKEYTVQREMEEQYVKVLHDKLTLTKASQRTEKLIKENRQKIEDLEVKCTIKEGEEAKLRLKISNIQAHINSMEEQLVSLKKELEEKEKTIVKSEVEIGKNHALIDKRQNVVAELSKKMQAALSNVGSEDTNSAEEQITYFNQEIGVVEASIKKMEQEWLRYQRELVTLTNEATAKFKEIDILRKKEAVLEEKKIRMEADINKAEKEVTDLAHTIERTQNDISRISALLYREKGLEEKLQQESETIKGGFVNALKSAELDFLKKESEVESLRKERTKLLCKLVETQQKVVVWEEKIRLVEEAKKVLKSETHIAEIASLNAEIRRLQVKCERIRKDEEALVQIMEKAAFQHANIYVKADIQQLRGTKKTSKPYFVTKTERLRKKIKEDKKKLEELKQEVTFKQQKVSELKNEEENQKSQLATIMDEIKLIDYERDKKQHEKWQDIISLSLKQKKSKLLELIKNDKYVRAVRNENLRPTEIARLTESLAILQDITKKIIASHPELESNLNKVLDHIAVGQRMQ